MQHAMIQPVSLNRILWSIFAAVTLITQNWYSFSAVLPMLQPLWNLTATQTGLIVASFQFGYVLYVLSVLICSFFSDTHSPQKILILGGLVSGLSSLAFVVLAHGFYGALMLRFIVGLGMGGVFVPGVKIVSTVFPPTQRGKVVGLTVSAMSLGSGLSIFYSGVFIAWFSWQALMVCTALGAGIGSWAVYALGTLQIPTSNIGVSTALFKRLLHKPILLINAGYMGHMWELYTMWPWIGPFMVFTMAAQGYDMQTAAVYGNTLGGISIIIGALATWIGGKLSDRYGRTSMILIFLSGSTICSMLIGWMIQVPIGLLTVVVIVYGFLVVGDSPILTATVADLAEPEIMGFTLGIQSVAGYGITILSPAVFGMVLDTTHSWVWAFTSLGLGAFLGVAALIFLRHITHI